MLRGFVLFGLLASLGEAEGFVPVLDAGSSPHGPYLVTPFLAGGTLRDRLRDVLDEPHLSVDYAALGSAHRTCAKSSCGLRPASTMACFTPVWFRKMHASAAGPPNPSDWHGASGPYCWAFPAGAGI